MAVAMASGSTSLGLCTNLRAFEKQPFSKGGLSKGFFGFYPVRRLCISPSKRYAIVCLIVYILSSFVGLVCIFVGLVYVYECHGVYICGFGVCV